MIPATAFWLKNLKPLLAKNLLKVCDCSVWALKLRMGARCVFWALLWKIPQEELDASHVTLKTVGRVTARSVWTCSGSMACLLANPRCLIWLTMLKLWKKRFVEKLWNGCGRKCGTKWRHQWVFLHAGSRCQAASWCKNVGLQEGSSEDGMIGVPPIEPLVANKDTGWRKLDFFPSQSANSLWENFFELKPPTDLDHSHPITRLGAYLKNQVPSVVGLEMSLEVGMLEDLSREGAQRQCTANVSRYVNLLEGRRSRESLDLSWVKVLLWVC